MAESLTEGNFLDLAEAELDQHIYRIMPEAFGDLRYQPLRRPHQRAEPGP